MNFSPKRSTEEEVFTVDFGPILAPGETITSAEWSITVVDGLDPTADAMLQGECQVSGTMVSQLIVSGVPGVTYAPICTVSTNYQPCLVLPEDGFGLLYIPG